MASEFTPPSGPGRRARGLDDDGRDGEIRRAAHLMGMSVYAFGDTELVRDTHQDAQELGVAVVDRADDQSELWDQQRLDLGTRYYLEAHGLLEEFRESERGRFPRYLPRVVFDRVAVDRTPESLIALLNLERSSESEIERVTANALLEVLSRGALGSARDALVEALGSEDPVVATMARAGLDVFQPDPHADQAYSGPPDEHDPETSIAIHGTWNRLVDSRARAEYEGWFRPDSELYRRLARATPDMFAGRGYFRWSGRYRQRDRDAAAADLPLWRARNQVRELDVVFAHSHGGNVALTALANGERARLLVLMHTPVIKRDAQEWARIRSSVSRVVVLGVKLDAVVLLDRLRHPTSRETLDALKLPHSVITPTWLGLEGWFDHARFIRTDTWDRYGISDEIAYELGLARTLRR